MAQPRIRRTFDERFEAVKLFGELFREEPPELCDSSRTKIAVSIGRGGRMKPVTVHYKHRPKGLSLDFISSPTSMIV